MKRTTKARRLVIAAAVALAGLSTLGGTAQAAPGDVYLKYYLSGYRDGNQCNDAGRQMNGFDNEHWRVKVIGWSCQGAGGRTLFLWWTEY